MKFDFKNVNLIPRKGIVESRSECDTSIQIGKYDYNLPVYPSNMESVINIDLAKKLAENGYFYTMHRFDINQIEFIKYFKDLNLPTSISIGVNEDSYVLLDQLVKLDLIPDYITIDIAHGHSNKMERMLQYITEFHKINSFIIAGNICTLEAAKDLTLWGANAIKIGIGPGEVCTTAMATRFGSRGIQPYIIKEISDFLDNYTSITEIKKPLIICDGGIREHGDIAVAITMGADLVMAGSLLAGFEDSPGDRISINNINYKEYWGSASQHQSGKTNRIEGTKSTILLKERSILDELNSIKESLQSAISYAGGYNLNAFKFVDFIINK